ncbi:hypothetical protein ACFV2H_46075 [Streptomyces sp. NPDC059629]|uniref:hypothetical protein n=1 Tax=Streptomyces sp. NPDC059629 TaxID=3346889 RepID=UPI0036C126C1
MSVLIAAGMTSRGGTPERSPDMLSAVRGCCREESRAVVPGRGGLMAGRHGIPVRGGVPSAAQAQAQAREPPIRPGSVPRKRPPKLASGKAVKDSRIAAIPAKMRALC